MTIDPLPSVNGWRLLGASGRIDALTAPEAEGACLAAIRAFPAVALDLSAVVFMSSAGLRVLLSSLKCALERGSAFALVAPQGPVQEVLYMSGFTDTFEIVEGAAALPEAPSADRG